MSSLYSFLDEHSLYVVLTIVLVIWAGIFIYLFRLDKKVNELFDQTESGNEDRAHDKEDLTK